MSKSFFLRLYEFLRPRPRWRWILGVAVILLLVARVSSLDFKEDITDFLPNDGEYPASLAAFGQYNGGNRIFAVVRHEAAPSDSSRAAQMAEISQTTPEETLIDAADRFAEMVQERDTAKWLSQVVSEIDVAQMMDRQVWWVEHAPYLLTSADWTHIDSAMRTPHFVNRQLHAAQSEMMLPTSGWQSATLAQDPLNLFSAPARRLLETRTNLHYDLHEGHIFSPDHRWCVVMLTTNAQGTATDVQARLKHLLEDVAQTVEQEASASNNAPTELEINTEKQSHHAQLTPPIRVQIIGAPTIAVGNAEQIKRDSTWAIAVAVVLTLGILLYTLRRVRHLLLIVLTVGFGWLVGLCVLSFTTSTVSLIVLGISSVIIGIAVNYPLHFLTHLPHAGSIRQNLRELVAPLLIGNVTTVGAFAALIPLHSVALRDLGVFAAAMLVGTIAFVLVALPHLVKDSATTTTVHSSPSQGEVENLEVASVPMRKTAPRYRTLGLGIALIATLLLGWTGRNVEFDANLAHLNYLSSEQRTVFGELAQVRQADTLHEPLYIAHRARTLEEALALREQKESTIASMIRKVKGATVQSVAPYLASAGEQAARLERWKAFVQENGTALRQQTAQEAAKLGFAPQAFAPFDSLLLRDFHPINAAQCLTMGEDALAPLVARDGKGRYIVTTVVNVPRGEADTLKQQLDAVLKLSMSHAKNPKAVEEGAESVWTFTPKSMNESVARHLSQDFSYIGWVCGAIVFGFLWLSFRRFSVAVLAFFPMVVSWLWILGSMSVFGLSFNLVNVILATFIFGQGDDYSIFVTEGLLYEYTYGRKLLAAYKRSILLSAVIMLIGVGTLAFAQHPALSSLGGLTIVGMGSVVAATLLLPAPVFSWWTRQRVASPWASPLSMVRLVQSALSRNAWALTHCCGIVWEDRTIGGETSGENTLAQPSSTDVAIANLGGAKKNVGDFSKNVGDFSKNVGVFSKNVGENFEDVGRFSRNDGDTQKKAVQSSKDNEDFTEKEGVEIAEQSTATGDVATSVTNNGQPSSNKVHTLHEMPFIGVWTAQDVRVKRWALRQHPEWEWMTLATWSLEKCRQLWSQGRQPMLEVGANAELLHRFAQQLQTLGETVVRPLIVAGEARVFPSGTRVLEHGRLTVAWGAPLAMEGDATGFVGKWYAHCAKTQRKLTGLRALVPHVVTSYSHKIEGAQARVARHLSDLHTINDQLALWEAQYTAQQPAKACQPLRVEDDGETAVLMALLHPEREFVALVEAQDAAALLLHLRCRPENLQVAPY